MSVSYLTQTDVEAEILRLVALLEEETYTLVDLAITTAQADRDYKQGWASAYLKAEGPVEARRCAADVANSDRRYQQKMADGLHDAKKELLRSIRAQLDSLRTISANVRSQT